MQTQGENIRKKASDEDSLTGTAVGKCIQYARQEGYTIISEQGASRSGKTYNTLLYLITYCLNHPKTKVSVVRASLPALKRSVMEDFRDIMMRLGEWSERNMNKTELRFTFGKNGSIVEFFSADDEQKLRGSKRDILFVNEANELRFMEWQQLKMRTTQFAVMDYNPSFSDEHWICQVNKDPRTYHFITTYKDNKYLEPEVVAEIESLKGKNDALWRIYGLGLQAVVEGLIFTNVEQCNEFPEYCKREYVGMDFGYENDPTAIVRVGLYQDRIYIDEITYKTKMLTNEIIRDLKQHCSSHKIISESADPRLIDEIHRAGLNIHPVRKYGGSVEAGIQKMLEYKIYVTKGSINVIKEFKNYTWAKDKEERYLNKPIDAFNHAIDAIRYVILNEVLGGERAALKKKLLYSHVY